MGPPAVGFWLAFRVWAKIGLLGFGGPAGQISLMHRELVDERRWISEGRFLHALNYCMLLPGPEAQQLAVYIGWLLHRTWGGIVAGVLFVLPGMIVLGILSCLYVGFGTTPWITALFFGLKAAVLAVVVEAVLRIGRRALKTRFLVGVATLAFVAIFAFHVPFPAIVLGAAALGIAIRRFASEALPPLAAASAQGDAQFVVDHQLASGRATHTTPSLPRALVAALTCSILWFLPIVAVAAWLGGDHVLAQQGWFFSQSAVVTFGGAYAVLAYVAQRAVEDFGWLKPSEMIDGLALAETTPGPLILVLQFVGFVAAYRHPGTLDPWLAAALGALLTSWVTFVPSFLFIFVGAPYIEALRRHAGLHAALTCVTAAVVGVILNLAAWFALHTVFTRSDVWRWGALWIEAPHWTSIEPGAAAISLAALVATVQFKVGLGWVLLASSGVGAAYWLLRHGVS